MDRPQALEVLISNFVYIGFICMNMTFIEVSLYLQEGLILFKCNGKYHISKMTFNLEELVSLINQIHSASLKLNPYALEWSPVIN
jgi:hypothetical protein